LFNVAVILAAGSGTRMKMDKSKMLLEINGKTVLERSVAVFAGMAAVDEIIVVCRECDLAVFSKLIGNEKVSFVIGGSTRQESVKNAVETMDECDYILIHDGARPLVTEAAVAATLEKAVQCGAAATGVRVKDTIKTVDNGLMITATPDRSSLVSIQTPQIFKFDLYKKAMQEAQRQGLDFTDDCQLVEHINQNVYAVIGDYENIKITTRDDIPHAESIVKARGEI